MPRPETDVYEFGPYRLDAGQRSLARGPERVPLAPKTFDLLLLLVRNGGRAVSKQELMTALWPDTFVEDTNLSFQVSTLRKALGDAGSAWIEAVPKHGYRFAAEVVTASLPAQMAGPSLADNAPGRVVSAPERNRKRWMLTKGLIASLLMFAAGYVAFGSRRSSPPFPYVNVVATPLTAYPGNQTGPSLSPDGNQVAFSWDGPGRDNRDITSSWSELASQSV